MLEVLSTNALYNNKMKDIIACTYNSVPRNKKDGEVEASLGYVVRLS